MKKNAFTLAEVLITLGIIGVVASLTIPTLMVKVTDKENAAKLKKIYSVMSQAYTSAKSEFGTIDEWGMGDTYVTDEETGESNFNQENASIVLNKFVKFLKVDKKCDKVTGCWYPDNLLYLNGEVSNENFDIVKKGRASLVLADGSLISFVGIHRACNAIRGEGTLEHVCGTIAIDVNGWKKPNQIGRDIFQFYLSKESIIPYGTKMETIFRFPDTCNIYSSGWGCTAWVIYNENMDYLKCDDLSWDTKPKCQ